LSSRVGCDDELAERIAKREHADAGQHEDDAAEVRGTIVRGR